MCVPYHGLHENGLVGSYLGLLKGKGVAMLKGMLEGQKLKLKLNGDHEHGVRCGQCEREDVEQKKCISLSDMDRRTLAI